MLNDSGYVVSCVDRCRSFFVRHPGIDRFDLVHIGVVRHDEQRKELQLVRVFPYLASLPVVDQCLATIDHADVDDPPQERGRVVEVDRLEAVVERELFLEELLAGERQYLAF